MINIIEYEHRIIGGLLLSPSLIDEIELSTDDFETESYKTIYQAIIDSIASNQVVDALTISTKLSKSNPGNNWLILTSSAVKDCLSPNSIIGYSKILNSENRNKKAKQICSNLLNEIDNAEDNESIVDNAVALLMGLNEKRQNHECSISQALKKSIDMIDLANSTDGPVGIATGIEKLDTVLGGFHDSDLYVIGARPSVGKTAFMLNLANIPQEQIGIISAEQPAEQIGIRMIAINGRVNAQKMRTGTLDDYNWEKITMSVSQLHTNNNIWINDKSGITIVELIRQARQWKHKHDIKALYIDYVQRIKWTDQRLARWEQVGNVVQSLKELARDLNIPVIALAQVNRDVEKRTDKRPTMADLANSSEIEKEADIVMTLYRDEVYDDESPQKGIMEINVCKNRHGPIGNVKAAWLEKYMRVENLSYRTS